MRVVIKPWGLAILLTVLFVLIALPVVLLRGRSADGRSAATAFAPPGGAPPAAKTPGVAPVPGGARGNLLSEANWRFYTERTARAFQGEVPDAPPARPAYRFSVEQTSGQDWNVGFNNKLRGVTLREGDKVRLRFQARSPSGSTIVVLIQKDAAPYPHSWKQYVRLGGDWKRYEYVIPAAAYADGEGLLTFFFGMAPGTVDLAGIQLERA